MSVRAWVFGLSALVVAFASMAYELMLAQSIAVIYGDTITSYSFVIGFFVLSLGLGSAFWARAERAPTIGIFWTIEMMLAVLGAVAPFLIFRVEFGGSSAVPWAMITALVLALAIGFLSGMEIPLLIALANPKTRTEFRTTRLVIGLDFIGTFLASIIVPLWLFATIGLVGVPFVGGLLNIMLGFGALAFADPKQRLARAGLTAVVGAALIFALYRVDTIEAFLSQGVF